MSEILVMTRNFKNNSADCHPNHEPNQIIKPSQIGMIFPNASLKTICRIADELRDGKFCHIKTTPRTTDADYSIISLTYSDGLNYHHEHTDEEFPF